RHLQRTREELAAALANAANAAERAVPTPDMVSSEVLQQMLRLRGTSGISPNLLAAPPRVLVQAPVIHDHQLLQSVGKGGYGEVWLAANVTGRYRAAKIIQRSTFKESRPYEREFEGICKFEPISRSHPGLVQILQVGRDEAD